VPLARCMGSLLAPATRPPRSAAQGRCSPEGGPMPDDGGSDRDSVGPAAILALCQLIIEGLARIDKTDSALTEEQKAAIDAMSRPSATICRSSSRNSSRLSRDSCSIRLSARCNTSQMPSCAFRCLRTCVLLRLWQCGDRDGGATRSGARTVTTGRQAASACPGSCAAAPGATVISG
jgi:hypothetical protein